MASPERFAGMRGLKIVGIVVAVLVVVVVGAGAALVLGGGPALKWALQGPGSGLVGRTIAVGGPVHVHWGDPTRIEIDNLRVANAGWSKDPDMLTAQRIDVTIFMRTLVFGPLRIPAVTIDGAKLLLEKSGDGVGNWKFSNGAPKKRTGFPVVQKFDVHDSQLIYRNDKTKAATILDVTSLGLAANDASSPVTVAADGSMAGSFEKLPVKFKATFGAFSALRDAAQPYPVKLNGSVGPVDVAIDGTIAHPLDFDGADMRLSMSGNGLDHVAALMGVPMPELPPFRGTSILKGGDGKWEITALTVKTGQSDLEGGIAIDEDGDVPNITANLTSSEIDLGDFKGLFGGTPAHAPQAEAAAPKDETRLIPDTKINTKKLPGINLTLNFAGRRIVSAGGLPFEAIYLGLKIKDGQLIFDPLTFKVALGDVSLHATFNPFTKTTPPHLVGDIDIRHVDLHKLLGGPTMSPIVRETAGTAGGFVKIDTTGDSLREFFARANGVAAFFVGNGQVSDLLQRLAPLDILEALGVYAVGDHPQPVTCLISRFNVSHGLATADTMVAKTPSTTIAGSGTIDLRSEGLNLALKPYNNSFTLVSLRTPVDIGGTLKKPQFHVEAMGLAAKLAAAVGLGVIFPPAAILPLVDTGLGPNNACQAAYAKLPPAVQSGTSVAPAAPKPPKGN